MKRKLTIAYILSIVSVIPVFFLSIPLPFGEAVREMLRKSVFALFHPVVNPTHQHPITIVVLLVFIISLIYSFRGSHRGRLVWLGCVFYFGYIQIDYFCGQILFFNKDNSWDYFWGHFFGQTTAYFFPFFFSLAAFIIGLFSLKDIEIRNKASYNKLTKITATVFIFYLILIISHLIFWLRINILIYHRGGEPLYGGGQDFINMITIMPFFVFVVITLLKKKELGAVIAPIALFPVAIPIIHDDLIRSFGVNIFRMISNLVGYIYRCVFQDLDKYITAYILDDPRKSISRIFRTTDHFLGEIRLVLLICGIVLIVLFLMNIKENAKTKVS